MKKEELILGAVVGGLLLKVLHNQKVIDKHIYEGQDGTYDHVYESDLIENNTVFAKIKGFFNKDK